jgi:carboxyl-terminal processing protease
MSLASTVQFERAIARGEEAQAQKAADNAGDAIQATDRAKTVSELRSKIVEQYVKPVNEGQMMQGAIKGMIQSLGDPYSDYLTPETLQQMEKQIAGSLVGIGAQLESHEQKVRVVTPLPGSPALKAGVQPGDVLLGIDGQPTMGMELGEAVKRIVGAAGTTVRLGISRDGGQKLDLTVTRGTITLPTIRPFQSAAGSEPDFLLDAAQKIGYIQVDQLGSAAPQEMKAAIESLQRAGLKGLILDLRNCPGGLLDSAVGVAKLFLSAGTIVTIQRRGGESTAIKADGGAASDSYPLVVLISGQTASAAEVLVGAVKDNQRALLLGTRTLGKGSIQTLIKLDEGTGAIKLTTSEYRLPSGRNIDKRPGENEWGIDPDDGYFVPLDRSKTEAMLKRRQERHVVGRPPAAAAAPRAVTPAWLEEQEHDPQLAAALKALSSRLQTGNYTKVSTLTAAQIQQFLKRDEIEQRRDVAAKNLQRIDEELAALGRN